LSTIAFKGITIERKVNRSRMNAATSTNPNTSGACDFIVSVKSSESAV
jgi:copper(I)-binding protein